MTLHRGNGPLWNGPRWRLTFVPWPQSGRACGDASLRQDLGRVPGCSTARALWKTTVVT
jgi:hypothetical protein